MRKFLRKWMSLDLGPLLLGGKVNTDPSARLMDHLWWLAAPFRLIVGIFSTPSRIIGNYYSMKPPLLVVIEQIKSVVACRAPLAMSLKIMAKDAPRHAVRRALYRLDTAVGQGRTLSEAMKLQPRFFPRYCVDLVRAGEEGGNLVLALENVIRIQEEKRNLVKAFLAPAQYFVCLVILITTITTFLAVKVFPVFGEMAREMGSTYESSGFWFHKMLIGFGEFVRNFPNVLRLDFYTTLTTASLTVWGVLLAVVVVVTLSVSRRRILSHMFLCIPLLRQVVALMTLSHIARLLSLLLRAGYTLDEALDATANSGVLRPFARMLLRVRDRVRQGQDFVAATSTESSFLAPVLLRGMTSTGQAAGVLPETLEQLADHYEARYFHIGAIASKFMLPIFILVAAGMAFTVYTYPFTLYSIMMDSLSCSF